MTFHLIGFHAWLGELAALMFIWAFIEVYSGRSDNLRRARWAVVMGLVLIFAVWIFGGLYYVEYYGDAVKPAIKAGPMPWAHGVVMETKEHVFLFLPFLGVMAYALVVRLGNASATIQRTRLASLWLLGAVAGLLALMALLGFLVSSSYRVALEGMVL